MAKVCEICGKKKSTGYQISHSHIRTKKTWNANIQKVRVAVKGKLFRRMNICTRCLKSNKIKRDAV